MGGLDHANDLPRAEEVAVASYPSWKRNLEAFVMSAREPHGDHEGCGEGTEAGEEDGRSTDRLSNGFHGLISPNYVFDGEFDVRLYWTALTVSCRNRRGYFLLGQ